MNERIKELAERAEEYTQEVAESTRLTPTSPQKISSIELIEIYNQKFAELIINECISQVEKDYYGGRESWDRSIANSVYNIKTHFGVE